MFTLFHLITLLFTITNYTVVVFFVIVVIVAPSQIWLEILSRTRLDWKAEEKKQQPCPWAHDLTVFLYRDTD